MAPLPKPESSTVRAIYAAYEAAANNYEAWGISVGELGAECDRQLWYTFRWATVPEQPKGRIQRIFRRGDIEEQRLIEDLERIGVDVFGQQSKMRLVGGHVRGKIDGRATGVPEAPITEHICEFKSANDDNFKALVKKRVREAETTHFVQCQIAMHFFGLTRALYMCTNKNDESIYSERVEYDAEYCIRLLARAERLINSHDAPPRISEDPDNFKCMFCKHKPVCHEGAFPRPTCRSCIFATAEMDGDGSWSCARFSKPLSIDEQRAGCPAHLFLPAMVPGEQIDADEAAETVTYRLKSGRVWVDGAGEAA